MINKVLLFIMLLVSFSFSDVTLAEKEYRFGVLNQSIEVPKDIMTFEEVLKLIQKSTGYSVVNKVDEIPYDKRYAGLKRYHIVGDLLYAVLKGYDATVDVDKKDYIIKIIYPETIYIDLPYGWPMFKTKEQFKRLFPYVNFYIEGNRLTAYGLPVDIAKLAPLFKKYQENAFKKDTFKISLYPYCTDVRKYVFLARRKYYGSEQYTPIKSVKVSLGQAEKAVVSYKDININITYDKANGIMEVGKYDIPVDDLSNIGLAFRIDSIQSPGAIGGFFSLLLSGKRAKSCNDVILVIDRIVPTVF